MRIAVAGQIRSGKNTFAKYFEDMGLVPFAFAEGISDVIDRYFPHARENGKPRSHYQIIGQTFRELNPQIWVEWLDAELQKHYRFYPDPYQANVIITDLRQRNEYEYLRKNGFTIVKIEADLEIRKERASLAGDYFSEEAWSHETETFIPEMPCDYLVTNNDDLASLELQVKYVYDEVLKNAKS